MSVNSKMTAIADKIRVLLGITGKLGLDSMASNLGTAVNACDSQTALIQQIKNELQGKTAGGSNDFVKTLFEQRSFVDENTTEIPADGFRGWQSVEKIAMPNVKNIGQYACYNCTGLTEIDFPVCETIGGYTFYNNTDVVSINMPALKTIGTNAFRQLTALASLRLPSLTDIAGTAFQKCTALEKADFSVAKSVGANAFNGCSVLTVLILRGDDPITLANANALTGTPIADGTGYVYFNRSIVESQKTLSNWATYKSQIRAIEDYPEITGG